MNCLRKRRNRLGGGCAVIGRQRNVALAIVKGDVPLDVEKRKPASLA
jgi:hypothetical protein